MIKNIKFKYKLRYNNRGGEEKMRTCQECKYFLWASEAQRKGIPPPKDHVYDEEWGVWISKRARDLNDDDPNPVDGYCTKLRQHVESHAAPMDACPAFVWASDAKKELGNIKFKDEDDLNRKIDEKLNKMNIEIVMEDPDSTRTILKAMGREIVEFVMLAKGEKFYEIVVTTYKPENTATIELRPCDDVEYWKNLAQTYNITSLFFKKSDIRIG